MLLPLSAQAVRTIDLHLIISESLAGDLDGDQYTVIWDKQLVTPKVAEVCMAFRHSGNTDYLQHFLYPPVKEKKMENITRQDLAAHFAGYNRYECCNHRGSVKI